MEPHGVSGRTILPHHEPVFGTQLCRRPTAAARGHNRVPKLPNPFSIGSAAAGVLGAHTARAPVQGFNAKEILQTGRIVV
jgi:hypothetical protein